MRTIIRIVPKIPLGPYPQLWLCGHVGKAPTSKIMIIISTISPIFISFCRTLGVQPAKNVEVGLAIAKRRLGMGRTTQRQFIYFQCLSNSFCASSLVIPYLSWILPTS